MVIDSSAIVAILTNELERSAFSRAIAADPVRLMSAATYLECALVLSGRMREARLSLDELVARDVILISAVDVNQARLAADAFDQFGRGRHPAKLNFGDCFSYALAKSTGEPLLFKGDDFTHTDVQRVL